MRFQDLLREHRIPFWTEGKYCRSGWVQFHCPFACIGLNPDKPYAGYNIAGNYVNCWRCGPHSVANTVMKLTGLQFHEVKKVLDVLDTPRFEEKIHLGKLQIPNGVDELLKPHKDYLRRRGFNVKELKRLWRIQGIGMGERLSWRIFIPIILRSQTVSWTTRSLVDTGSRYISASEAEEAVPHKDLLYGEDYATTAISIHEGPTDVWAVGPAATATLGTGWTSAQILRMSRYARRIVCFDNQPQAQARARKLCSLLEVFPGETINVVLDAKDAGSADEGELRKFRKMLT